MSQKSDVGVTKSDDSLNAEDALTVFIAGIDCAATPDCFFAVPV